MQESSFKPIPSEEGEHIKLKPENFGEFLLTYSLNRAKILYFEDHETTEDSKALWLPLLNEELTLKVKDDSHKC